MSKSLSHRSFYTMKVTCLNCGTRFPVTLRKGLNTENHKTECPYCGIKRESVAGYHNFEFDQPVPVVIDIPNVTGE